MWVLITKLGLIPTKLAGLFTLIILVLTDSLFVVGSYPLGCFSSLGFEVVASLFRVGDVGYLRIDSQHNNHK